MKVLRDNPGDLEDLEGLKVGLPPEAPGAL